MSTAEQYELNKNLAQMLKGGVIMDVTTPEQAKMHSVEPRRFSRHVCPAKTKKPFLTE